MRYYYTDPLAAAWMECKFGMRFQASTLKADIGKKAKRLEDVISNGNPDNWHTITSGLNHRRPHMPLYVHPDSYGILEPQVGDVINVGGEECWYWTIVTDDTYREAEEDEEKQDIHDPYWCTFTASITALSKQKNYTAECDSDWFGIVLRNGIRFMWPEVEQ